MFGYSKEGIPADRAAVCIGGHPGGHAHWPGIQLAGNYRAEMVAASTGLGHMILFAQQMSRTDRLLWVS